MNNVQRHQVTGFENRPHMQTFQLGNIWKREKIRHPCATTSLSSLFRSFFHRKQGLQTLNVRLCGFFPPLCRGSRLWLVLDDIVFLGNGWYIFFMNKNNNSCNKKMSPFSLKSIKSFSGYNGRSFDNDTNMHIASSSSSVSEIDASIFVFCFFFEKQVDLFCSCLSPSEINNLDVWATWQQLQWVVKAAFDSLF